MFTCLTLRNASAAVARKLIIKRKGLSHVKIKMASNLIQTSSLNIVAHFISHPFTLKHLIVLAFVVDIELV